MATNGKYYRPPEKRNTWKWMKKLVPVFCVVLGAGLLTVLLFVERQMSSLNVAQTEPELPTTAVMIQETESKAETTAEVKPVLELEGDVLLCSEIVKRLYDGEVPVELAIQSKDPYRSFAVQYSIGNKPGTFLLSESADMRNAKAYPLEAFSTVIRVDNLKTGTKYYYTLQTEDGTWSGQFTTAESNRFVTISGIKNTRDIGGSRTLDGYRVRQGVLIRGSEVDGLVYEKFKIPEEVVPEVLETFGFRYDFDLRSGTIYQGEYHSPLGIPHRFYASPQYEQIFEAGWAAHVGEIFRDLADPEKYPMYMHCTWGKDRTGTILFLLQGVLNMSEEDMMREYMLSGFIFSEIAEERMMDPVIQGLQKYEGESLQEKIVTYLTTDAGVTQEELDTIREIFLEP